LSIRVLQSNTDHCGTCGPPFEVCRGKKSPRDHGAAFRPAAKKNEPSVQLKEN
jgi:hypothetical protein